MRIGAFVFKSGTTNAAPELMQDAGRARGRAGRVRIALCMHGQGEQAWHPEAHDQSQRLRTTCWRHQLVHILSTYAMSNSSTHRSHMSMHLLLLQECAVLTCCVSSGTVRARYCWLPRLVSGVKPTMKKWRRGKGIRFTASLRRSAFSWPAGQQAHQTSSTAG